MAYFSKDFILQSYKILSSIDDDHKQGAIQKISAIRYFIALDRFFKSYKKDCNTKERGDTENFNKFVGEFVSVFDGYYTNMFYTKLIHDSVSYGTASNFYSTGVVQNSLANTSQIYDYPRRSGWGALMKVQAGKLIRDIRLYSNFVKEPYLCNNELRFAICIWLLRNSEIDSVNTYKSVKDILFDKYTKEFCDIILPSEDLFTEKANAFNITFSEIKQEISQIDIDTLFSIPKEENTTQWEQKIYFGSPGSGKSFTVRKKYESGDPKKVIRTTFHPDTDYATFVGCYKPKKEDGKITYEFIPQSFTEAYVKAWNDLDSQYYLILEEINRGNCAQIFGDLFQLLDRNEDGWSEYPINADSDLKNFLLDAKDENGEYILKNKDGILDGKLCLPPNLSIIASMNTSDQSLFPMDSAFKRRWTWEYVPIDYANAKSGQFTITIGTKIYRWHDFLEKINDKIKSVTSSEDKQMGNFFIKHSVDEKEFKDKVMFYIWSEVGKDNYQTNEAVFKCYKPGTTDKQEFSFNELYSFGSTQKMQDFMAILQVPEYDTQQESFEADEDETPANGGRGKTMSLNGGNLMFKSELGFTIMDKYITEHPELSYQLIKATFPDTLLGHNLHRGLVVDTATDLGSYDRYYSSKTFTSQDGVQFRIYKQWTKHNIENIANFARKQGWSVEQR